MGCSLRVAFASLCCLVLFWSLMLSTGVHVSVTLMLYSMTQADADQPTACLSACVCRCVQPALFKPSGLNFNMQQTAARTREGLAKISLPFKLPGGSSGDGQP
jgi:hypothetical protein